MSDPFVRTAEHYRRDYDIFQTYLDDASKFLSLKEGISIEEAKTFITQLTAVGGRHPIQSPMARYLHRDEKGDRHRRQAPLDQFWSEIRRDEQILSPSQTSYLNPAKKKSILGVYIAGNLKKRSEAKAAQFAAERAGNEKLQAIMNAAQTTYKIKNNALSGAHSSPYTILYNKTAHSSLTSSCRAATGYGNAHNERFLYGNRHYWSPAITKQNIISIVNHSDLNRIARTMEQFELTYPSIDDVMSMVERSTHAYWRGEQHLLSVRELVEKLTPVQLAAVLFTGDLYHLSQINPDFVKTLIHDFLTCTDQPLSPEECNEWSQRLDDELKSYISMLCPEQLLDTDSGNYKAFKEVKDATARGILIANGKRVLAVQERYREIIETFWTTDNIPSSVNYLPNILRRCVVTSDTDSTIFSVARWPIWYLDSTKIDARSMAVSATMIYLASKTVANVLARYSANCGYVTDEVFSLQLKNEFYMPVFCLTSRAKHYFAYITMQEGTTKRVMEFDVKGVALRNSNVPPEITKRAHALMKSLMQTIMDGKTLSLRSVIKTVALIENQIKEHVTSGQFSFLRRMMINHLESYKADNGGNYVYYQFWEQVFARKYGAAPDLPYRAVKVSLDINNKTQMQRWINSLEDPTIAANLRDFLREKGKTSISTVLLPEANLLAYGMPKEIIPVIDVRTLLYQTMESFYMVLESLGYYTKDKNITRLLSDIPWLLDHSNTIKVLDI